MERMDEFVLTQYMTIEKRIEQLQRKKKYKQWLFYQQSFYTSIVYTGYEVIAQSIKADKAVEALDGMLRAIDHQIEILQMKQGFRKKFLASLTARERSYFHKRYILGYVCLNERLDTLALEEIKEISQAIVMRYCTMEEYQEPIELIEDDFMGNIDRLLDVVGV